LTRSPASPRASRSKSPSRPVIDVAARPCIAAAI
jgi:hypothetical protein